MGVVKLKNDIMESNLIRTEEYLVKRINSIDEAIEKSIERLIKKESVNSYLLNDGTISTKTEYESAYSINESIVSLESHRNYFMKQLKKLQSPKTDKIEK